VAPTAEWWLPVALVRRAPAPHRPLAQPITTWTRPSG